MAGVGHPAHVVVQRDGERREDGQRETDEQDDRVRRVRHVRQPARAEDLRALDGVLLGQLPRREPERVPEHDQGAAGRHGNVPVCAPAVFEIEPSERIVHDERHRDRDEEDENEERELDHQADASLVVLVRPGAGAGDPIGGDRRGRRQRQQAADDQREREHGPTVSVTGSGSTGTARAVLRVRRAPGLHGPRAGGAPPGSAACRRAGTDG